MKFDGPLLQDRWRLGPRVGRGAQARTYLARDEQAPGERVVVVKQLRFAERREWKAFDLYEREVRTLKALDHPGIPRYLEAFESEPGVFNLVMERAPGATLWAYSRKVKFSQADLVDILRQGLELVAYLHGRSPPVVHRDIKPTNLVRAADGRLSLVDFGGVRDAARPEGGSTVIGTFGYMAPEQLHGDATPATDLYALGATLVALAGGVQPEHVPRKGLRMDLDRHLPALDPTLRATLQAMVEPDPADRPQRAAEVLARLAGGAPTGLVAAPRAAPPASAPASEPPLHPVVGEVASFVTGLPFPARPLVRVLVTLLSVGGYVGLSLLRLVFLPVAFAIVSAAAGQSRQARVDEVRGTLEGGVDEARRGLRALV